MTCPSSRCTSAGGASRATQRLAVVGQLRRPYVSCTDVHKNDVWDMKNTDYQSGHASIPFIVQPGGHAGPPLQCVCWMTPQTRDANANVGADRCVCPVHTDAIHQCITRIGRTVKPFHNGNRGVARSGTCGNLPRPTTPKEVEPFPTLTPVRPLQGRFLSRRIPAGGASRATQRLAIVG